MLTQRDGTNLTWLYNLGHGFSAFPDAARARGVAGRPDLFRVRCRPHGLLGGTVPHAASRRRNRWPIARRTALDGNCLWNRLPDYFGDLQPDDRRERPPARRSSPANRADAALDRNFAVRHLAKNARTSRPGWRNRRPPARQPSSHGVQSSACLIGKVRAKRISAGIGCTLPD